MRDSIFRGLKTRAVLLSLCTLLWAGVAGAAFAQSPPPSPSAPAPLPPLPLADIVPAADAASARLSQTEQNVSADQTIPTTTRDLAPVTEEITARLEETNRHLSPGVPLDMLRDLEARWRKLNDQLALWTRDLTERATFIEREIARLPQMRATWKSTLDLARNEKAPPELTEKIAGVLAQIDTTESVLQKQRAAILSVQTRVAEQTQRVAGAVRSLQAAQSAAVNRLWVRDSPPLWSAELRGATPETMMHEGQASFRAQVAQLRAYLTREWAKLICLALLFGVLAFVLMKVKQHAARWTAEDPALAAANRVLQLPLAMASVLTFLFCRPLFPEAPRLFWVALATVALVPIIILLRRLLERHLFPILNALVAFYLVAQIRGVIVALPLFSRVVLLLETVAGAIFLAWFVGSTRRVQHRSSTSRKITRAAARVGIVLFAVVFVTNSLGYVGLSNYLASGGLGAAYLALLLYAAAGIVEGLSFFALQIRPLGSLAVVQQHRGLIRRRIAQFVVLAGFVLWFLLGLGAFSLRETVIEKIGAILNAELAIRSLRLSLGAVLTFALTIWVTVLISRFLRFVLEAEVYSRLRLARGSSYAVSTILNYLVLLAGFFLALAAVGVDMTRFAVLAGAFGVGIGFGLQNIFNNFFSGLILLFERPIQVGDVIEVGNATGTVRRIGIRASVILLADKTQLIVPNGQLISEKVSNRTVSGRQKTMTLRVRVGYGSDPTEVIRLLTQAAVAHPKTIDAPAPEAYMKEFSPDALLFDLNFTTEDVDRAPRIQSDVAVAVNAALNDAGIEIPLPQRNVRLENCEALGANRSEMRPPPNQEEASSARDEDKAGGPGPEGTADNIRNRA